MAEKPTRLSDFGGMAEAKTIISMADIAGEEVTVTAFTLKKGEHGPYMQMKITKADGEVITVNTASTFIMAALREAKAKNALPVPANFFQHGKTWLVE